MEVSKILFSHFIYRLNFVCVLIWILPLSFCKGNASGNVYFVPANNSSLVTLEYGSPLGEISPNGDLFPHWEITNTDICFSGRNKKIVDYGPRFSLCIPLSNITPRGDLESVFPWRNIQNALLFPESLRSYPNIRISSEDSEILWEFVTERSIVNRWKKNPPGNFFLGDHSLKRLFGQTADIYFSGKSIFTSRYYGIPYWNYVEDDACYFLFSSWNLDIPRNQRRLLKITLDCEYISPIFSDWVIHVQSINEKEKINCRDNPLQLTEIFSQSESKFQRFLEFSNTSEVSSCFRKWEIPAEQIRSIHGEMIPFEAEWEFLFPGATVLLGSEETNLEAYGWIKNFNWSSLTRADWKISHTTIGDWEYPSGFRFEDEYISWKKMNNPCSLEFSHYPTQERFCGSPGVNLPIKDAKLCSQSDIHLTEINFWGIQDSLGDLDSRDRYLELQFINENPESKCDLSSFWLDMGNLRFPLAIPSTNERIQKFVNGNIPLSTEMENPPWELKNGEIFIVSLSTKLPQNVMRIQRNLFSLNPRQTIILKTWGQDNKKILFNPNPLSFVIEPKIIPWDEMGNLHSLVPGESKNWFHHPREEFPYWGSRVNYMSPGRVDENSNRSINTQGSIEITEVHWAGSYRNRSSILNDRFVEWRNRNFIKNSIYLSIFYPGFPQRNQIYFLPLSGEEYSIISRGNLTCFPDVNSIRESSFRLFHGDAVFQFHTNDGKLLDEFELDSSHMGENSTARRIRRSASKHAITGEWMSSSSMSSTCPNETFATPGKGEKEDDPR